MLPDCYDPVYQENRRQEKWDKHCEDFPHCCECGNSVYPYDTYTQIGEFIFCEKCVSKGTHSIDELEE
jgi:hypothetical protein